MNTFTHDSQIKCGNHLLKPEVAIIERLREKIIADQPITLKEPPEIIIRCATCGREATACRFTIDAQLVDRTFH